MPATLLFDDPEATVTPPDGHQQPQPVTLGPSWQANDFRVLMVTGSAAGDGGAVSASQPMTPDPPTGWAAAYNLNPTPGYMTQGVYHRQLAVGDDDTSVGWPKPPTWQQFNWAMFTARGVDPANPPTAGRLAITHRRGDTTCSAASVTVPGAGVMVFFVGTMPDIDNNWPAWASSLGLPTGWKKVAATDKSGDQFTGYDTSNSLLVMAKAFTGSGSTGALSIPVAAGTHPAFVGMWMFVRAAPDSVSTGSAMVEIASLTTGTSTTSTNPVSQGSPMVATDSMSGGFNPLIGYTVIPYRLRGNPVQSSRIQWDIVLPAGSTAKFESSINNGLSWDECSNWAPIPRLLPGDTTTRKILIRVISTRQSPTGGTPRLRSLKVRIGCRRSYDELLRTFYGPADKSKTTITAGSSGGSGGSSGGAGTVVRGGGQFGGGPIVNLHATDPSRLLTLAGWPQPYSGPAGLTIDQLLRAMVLARRPNQKLFNQVSTQNIGDDSAVWGLNDAGDVWKDIRALANSGGQEAFYGVNDDFNSRPVPDPRYGPVAFEFDHASRACIIGSESELDISLVVNGYIIQGESTTTKNPVSAFAYDSDPQSKYNLFPPPIGIGPRIKRLKFPLAQTVQQCQDIANALLYNSLGMANTVTIRIVKHPGIALGDVARINNPESGVTGRFLVKGYTLPDGLEDMELTCFRQTA